MIKIKIYLLWFSLKIRRRNPVQFFNHYNVITKIMFTCKLPHLPIKNLKIFWTIKNYLSMLMPTGMDQMDSNEILQIQMSVIITEWVLKNKKIINAQDWFQAETTMTEINHQEPQVLSKIFRSLSKKPELTEEWQRTTKYSYNNKLLKK